MFTQRKIEKWIVRRLSELIGPKFSKSIDPKATFFQYGLDSLAMVMLSEQLSELTGMVVSIEMIFDHPTPRELAEFLGKERSALP
jgi:acyl carrier protein